jgi:hypothetical protein
MLCSGAVAASSVEELVAESRKAVKEFADELKGELLAALKGGGPVNAVTVCSRKAPAIADRISKSKRWEVGRTSLRIRNPKNTPDAWERKTLESFEERRKQGEDIGKMEHSEMVTEGGKSLFRYMKAIPAGELCLTCHGKDLAPDLAAKLRELYPEDQATGFSLGEIRGAFTIIQPI